MSSIASNPSRIHSVLSKNAQQTFPTGLGAIYDLKTHNRFAYAACVDGVRAAWEAHNASSRLVNPRPDDYNRLSPAAAAAIVAWADGATAH